MEKGLMKLTKKERGILTAMYYGKQILGVWVRVVTLRNGDRVCTAPFQTMCGPFIVSPKNLTKLVRAGLIAKGKPYRLDGRYILTSKGREFYRRCHSKAK